MSSLARRLLSRDILTLQDFAHEAMARLEWEYPEANVARPRPDVLAVAHPNRPPAEFPLQPFYRAYQKDPRTRDATITRFVEWVGTGASRA